MPLRDHFHPPLTNRFSWEEVHGGWPMVIVQQLSKLLPQRYTAGPRVHLGPQFEIDVASYKSNRRDRLSTSDTRAESNSPSGAATAVWIPTQPMLTVETELADYDEYEVRVYDSQRGRRLVAAIELVSPANKDRPGNRQQFTSKCAALLRRGVCVVIVDIVTSREANLYAELLKLIGHRDPTLGDRSPATYAVASRWKPCETKHCLETWCYPLKVNETLPVLPLWLSDTLAIPLDLEASYEQTCRDLRIAPLDAE